MIHRGSQAISLDDVSKSFAIRSAPAIEALSGLSLKVAAGAFVAVVGPSGCGKSTLLRLIAGLEQTTFGSVSIHGAVVRSPRADTGLVFQRPTLLPWRTVEENVLLPADVLQLDRDAARHDAAKLIELVGLAGFEDRYPAQLSGGMQQRAAIARSLAHDPPILLLDEPFGALDALLREQMAVELQRIWLATGKTVLLVTHSIPEAVLLADRVLVMTARPGRIAADITINLVRPRTLEMIETSEFSAHAAMVRNALRADDRDQSGAADDTSF